MWECGSAACAWGLNLHLQPAIFRLPFQQLLQQYLQFIPSPVFLPLTSLANYRIWPIQPPFTRDTVLVFRCCLILTSGCNQASVPLMSVCWHIVMNSLVNLQRQKTCPQVANCNSVWAVAKRSSSTCLSWVAAWAPGMRQTYRWAARQECTSRSTNVFCIFRWKLFQTWMKPRVLDPFGPRLMLLCIP